MSLIGKRIWIVGAGGAIGKDVAYTFANNGAKLVLLGKTLNRLLEVKQTIDSIKQKHYVNHIIETIDVSDPESVNKFVELHQEPPAILINLAAVSGFKTPFEALTYDDWSRVLATDLTGSMLVVQAAAKLMAKEQYGRIVLMSSYHAFGSYKGMTAYAAAKAGICGMVRQLAIELGPAGITINAVCPGAVETPRTRTFLEQDNSMEMSLLQHTPTGRFTTPQEISSLILFLCSPETRHINGQCIVVDGGYGINYDWEGNKSKMVATTI